MPVTIKITVNKNFLPTLLNKAGKGLINAGEVLESKAKQLAPVVSGKLKKSIKITKESNNKIRVGSDLVYAYPKEFGTVAGGRVIAAKPYLRPALKESKEKMKQAFLSAGKNK